MDVSGLVAVVTGGGRGIGRGICLALARNGADVVVADLEGQDTASVAADVQGMGRRAMTAALDVTDQASVDAMTAKVLDAFGQVDVLVNNAGVISIPGWMEGVGDDEGWNFVYEVNVKGVARMTGAVSPSMKERRFGKIVNIASVAGRQGRPPTVAYAASKAACISITQSAATQLAPYDINVNAICPGLLWTPMWEVLASRQVRLVEEARGRTPREQFDAVVASTTPLGREQTPEDIGNLAAFLASKYARNITGQAINVCGAFHMS